MLNYMKKTFGTGRRTRFVSSNPEKHIEWLGLQVQALRIERGWTQSVLAEKTGLSRQLLSLIENGKGNCTLATIVALAHAFDRSLFIVLSDNEEERRQKRLGNL